MGLDFLQMMLDPEFSKDKVTVQRLLEDALREGYVTPINTVTFDPLEVAEAFKMAAEGSQNGKIVIKFREEEKNSTSVPKAVSLNAAPQVTCDPDKSYVIVGGIGGFGLDLAQWLVTRGCTKLVLTGSNKEVLQSGYLQRRIKLWQSEGVKVTSALDPCDNIDGARGIMALAQTLAPVGGVFLVNRMYRAGDLVDQSEDAFKEIFRRTVQPITYLDSVTRDQTLRSTVHLFVAFTSVVGSRGQAGQTNFAFANAYIDRVCKKRAIDGLPARTIQWGAVGDICLPTSSWEEDTDGASACGTEPQSLKSRQQALDVLMSSPYVATSSYVLPSSDIGGSGSQSRGTKLQLIVAKEFGLPDFSEYDPNSTLADLGMDSIMGAQVKTIFDNEYKLFLTTGDLSNLTIDDMRKIDEKTYVMPQSS
ncbi:fatty acid synthase [Aplysia californica]|uniref:Fatty acid synthase n=1 Tax=Aplysia californica TaxID=6500 RepID=A0ABM0JI52_APLCA|nr:fatty acid synthase [Aplysia californica]